jgi:hypothetical protein
MSTGVQYSGVVYKCIADPKNSRFEIDKNRRLGKYFLVSTDQIFGNGECDGGCFYGINLQTGEIDSIHPHDLDATEYSLFSKGKPKFYELVTDDKVAKEQLENFINNPNIKYNISINRNDFIDKFRTITKTDPKDGKTITTSGICSDKSFKYINPKNPGQYITFPVCNENYTEPQYQGGKKTRRRGGRKSKKGGRKSKKGGRKSKKGGRKSRRGARKSRK